MVKKSEELLPLGSWGKGVTRESPEGIFWNDGNVLYLDRNLGYTGI